MLNSNDLLLIQYPMISNNQLIVLFIALACWACDEAIVVEPDTYACSLSFPDVSDQHPLSADFQALLDDYATELPGVQVALRTPDGLTWTGAAGMADIPNNVPLAPCHLLMVGSISKVFTATLIFQLQDEGKLSLDEPLRDWIDPEIVDQLANADQVTLRQMLNHTSGLPDYLDNADFNFDAINTPFNQKTVEQKLEYAYGMDATHAPGETYYYSNTNFVLLGLVVERVTGMTLPEALDARIFSPLGMNRSVMGTPEDPLPAGTVRPYLDLSGGRFIDFEHIEVADAATGDGGIASNTQELQVFIESLFSGQLLSAAAFTEMTETLTVKPEGAEDFEDWPDEATGYGIDRFQTNYGIAYGHTGAIFAFNAFLFHYPENGATLAIAYNGTSLVLNDRKEELRKALMALLFE